MVEKGDTEACREALLSHLDDIVPDREDMLEAEIALKDGKPELTLIACHSRSYALLTEALKAACPEEIRQRWRITLQP